MFFQKFLLETIDLHVLEDVPLSMIRQRLKNFIWAQKKLWSQSKKKTLIIELSF